MTVIVAAVWLGVTVSRVMIDKNRQADREELFGYREVEVVEPERRDGETRTKMGLGARYFEATRERLDALEGAADAELVVEAAPWVEEVSVDETDGQVTVTAWRSCDAATKYWRPTWRRMAGLAGILRRPVTP